MAKLAEESWHSDGLTFGPSSIGNSMAEVQGRWDDGAMLKAFDEALNTHSRRHTEAAEAREMQKNASQDGVAHLAAEGRPLVHGAEHGADGIHEYYGAESRFAALLAKGNAQAAAAGPAAGVPGPWEPVAPREVEQNTREMPRQPSVQGSGDGRGTDYATNPRAGERGAYSYAYPNGPPPPAGGSANEEGRDRYPPPPPPVPSMPHGIGGPHAVAFQSLEGVYDDDLADLLLAWYYSGYYTGRYRAMQEARKPRFGRPHPPPAHVPPPGPPTEPPGAYAAAEGWERHGSHTYHNGGWQSPALRSVGK